jgi:hypothetical protein
MAARMAIIAMTTNNSISVKPFLISSHPPCIGFVFIHSSLPSTSSAGSNYPVQVPVKTSLWRGLLNFQSEFGSATILVLLRLDTVRSRCGFRLKPLGVTVSESVVSTICVDECTSEPTRMINPYNRQLRRCKVNRQVARRLGDCRSDAVCPAKTFKFVSLDRNRCQDKGGRRKLDAKGANSWRRRN